MILSTKVKKRIDVLSRIIIAIVSVSFIYWQVTQPDSFSSFAGLLQTKWDNKNFQFYLLSALLLMPVNWGIEAYKWKKLISLSETISFGHALQSVFTGISISLFTPNRVGEFLGRSLTLKNTPLIKGSLLTIVGSISQLITTLFIGAVALVVFIPYYYTLDGLYSRLIYIFIIITGSLFILILLLLFMRVSYLSGLTAKIIKPHWKKIRTYMRIVRRLSRELLLTTLLLSIARYIIFTTQYYFLIKAFGIEISFFHAIMLIALIYLVMTAIPTIALVDLGIKGSVSIYFFNLYFYDVAGSSIAVLAASSSIWLINLALPSLLGLMFINRVKFIHK